MVTKQDYYRYLNRFKKYLQGLGNITPSTARGVFFNKVRQFNERHNLMADLPKIPQSIWNSIIDISYTILGNHLHRQTFFQKYNKLLIMPLLMETTPPLKIKHKNQGLFIQDMLWIRKNIKKPQSQLQSPQGSDNNEPQVSGTIQQGIKESTLLDTPQQQNQWAISVFDPDQKQVLEFCDQISQNILEYKLEHLTPRQQDILNITVVPMLTVDQHQRYMDLTVNEEVKRAYDRSLAKLTEDFMRLAEVRQVPVPNFPTSSKFEIDKKYVKLIKKAKVNVDQLNTDLGILSTWFHEDQNFLKVAREQILKGENTQLLNSPSFMIVYSGILGKYRIQFQELWEDETTQSLMITKLVSYPLHNQQHNYIEFGNIRNIINTILLFIKQFIYFNLLNMTILTPHKLMLLTFLLGASNQIFERQLLPQFYQLEDFLDLKQQIPILKMSQNESLKNKLSSLASEEQAASEEQKQQKQPKQPRPNKQKNQKQINDQNPKQKSKKKQEEQSSESVQSRQSQNYSEEEYQSKSNNQKQFQKSNYSTRSKSLKLSTTIEVLNHKFVEVNNKPKLQLEISQRYGGFSSWHFYDNLWKLPLESQREAIQEYLSLYNIQVDQQLICKSKKNTGGSVEKLEGFNSSDNIDLTQFGSGWYYGKRYQHQLFQPQKLNFRSMWFEGGKIQVWMDCVIHAINYAVGFRNFTCREQVIRLMQKKMRRTEDEVLKFKSINGISLSYLKDVVADDEKLYSLKNVFNWEKIERDLFCKDFTNFIKLHPCETFILLARIQGLEATYGHAMTVKKCSKGLALFDSSNSSILFSEVDCNCASFWNISAMIKKSLGLQLYVFEEEPAEKDFQLRMEILESIMTGEAREQYRAKDFISKRGKKSRRKRFTHQKKKALLDNISLREQKQE